MEPGALIRKHSIDVAVMCCLLCVLFFATNKSFSERVDDPYGQWYAVALIVPNGGGGGMDRYYAYIEDFATMTSKTHLSLTRDGQLYQEVNGCDPWAQIDFTRGYSIWEGHSYHYRGIGNCGEIPQVAEITVALDAFHVVIYYFYANPATTVPPGGSTLYWSTTNATSATINGTPVSISGSMAINPTSTTIYMLSATNPVNSAQALTAVRTNEPLVPQYYRYSVRHEKGASQFFPHLQVEQESVNSANGNLSFAVPLLSRPGRSGMGIDLKLAYNSKIWDFFVQGSTLYATLPEYDSWVGPGWTFTTGRIIDDSANGYYYLTTSDGSSHTLTNYGGAWRSMDSTYMVYDPVARKLTLKNGMNLSFSYQDPARPYIWYATRMQDTNGNYVDIAYSGTGGRISYIYDTLGNTYTFLLNSGGGLQYIRYWNTNDTTQATSTVSFGYASLWPSFGSQATMDPLIGTQQMLSEVMYLTGVRYSFSYNSSGQVAEITYPTLGTSRYFYTKYTVYDRLLGRTVPDFYVSSHDTGAGSGTWTWSNNPLGNVAPSTVNIVIPGRSTLTHYMQKSSSGWADGFVTKIAYSDSTLSRRTLQDWTQDDEQLVTIKNPRPSWISSGGKWYPAPSYEKLVRKEFSYAPAGEYSGNVKEIREYQFDQVTLWRKTVLSYLHESNGAYASLNILDRVTSSLVYNRSNNLVSKTVTAYDAFSPLYGAPNAIRHDPAFGTTYLLRGLPTGVTRWHNIAQNGSVTASTKYDECGNARELIDPLGHTNLMEYWLSSADNAYAFPLRATNAKGHVSQATYSYRSGAAKNRTDTNGLVTTLTYDNYDRLTQSTNTDGARSTVIYVEHPWYQIPPYALINKYMTESSPMQKRVDLDNLGRLTEVTVLGNIKQEQTYDTAGAIKDRSLPHIDGQTPYLITNSNGGVATQSVTYPNAATVTYYNGPQNMRAEANNGQKSEYWYYENGKIGTVLEQDPATGALNIPTYYGYDDLDRLTGISQGAQARAFTYDDMGRRLTETHPETGTTSYVYNGNSDVVQKTDSRGIVTSYSYDELGRITLKTYSDGTPQVSYIYDVQPADSPISIANPVGRLTKLMTTSSGVTVKNFYSYCSCSSVNQESTVIIDGTTKTYTTSYSHNLAGQLTSITYPDGRVVNYTRDDQGREIKVSSTASGQAFDYVYGATYGGPQGALTEIQYSPWAIGLKTLYSYSPLGYLSQLRVVSNQSWPDLRQDWSFTYSGLRATPQISDIQDNLNYSQGEHYQYDKLDRLTSWWISQYRTDPPSRKMDVSYDRYGNIVGIVDGTTPYTFNVDPATNRLLSRMGWGGQTSFSYDNAGNATSYGPFDAENRLRSKAGTNYLYDGTGRRFRKQGSSTINYVYSYSGILLQEDNVTTAAKDDFIYFNGQNVVVHGQNPTTYKLLLRDYLGSVRKSALVTFTSPGNLSFSLCEQYTYDPWGQIISSVRSNPPYTDFKYQNKERDGGLDYFGARYYDGSYPGASSAMRWISPDPVMSRIYDPQSLNRYTYVRNDPINKIDPNGRFWLWTGLRAFIKWFDSPLEDEGEFSEWGMGGYPESPKPPGPETGVGDSSGKLGASAETIARAEAMRSNPPTIAGLSKEDKGAWKKAWEKLIDTLVNNEDCANAFGGLANALSYLSGMKFEIGVYSGGWYPTNQVPIFFNPNTGFTTINSNGAFFTQQDAGVRVNMAGLSGDNLRAFNVMHELGHQIPGLFKNDSISGDANTQNSNLILKPCFGKTIPTTSGGRGVLP